MPLRASARHQLGKLTYQRVGFVGFGDESSASRQRAGIGLNTSGGYENGDLRPTLGAHARECQAGPSRHQLGRARCGERVCQYVLTTVVAGSLKKKQRKRITAD